MIAEMLVELESASLEPLKQYKTNGIRLIVADKRWTIEVQPDGRLRVNLVGKLAPVIQVQPGGGVNSIILGGTP